MADRRRSATSTDAPASPRARPDRLTGDELDALVAQARDGDEDAWARLVRGLAGAVNRGLMSFDLPPDVRHEAFHLTFVRLVERIDTIEAPRALPMWLITTARREAIQLLRRRSRTVPVEHVPDAVDHRSLDEALLDNELVRTVMVGFHRLSARCQQLLRLLTIDPPLSYQEVAELLGRSTGYIGPTRARCLDELRRTPEVAAVIAGDRGEAP